MTDPVRTPDPIAAVIRLPRGAAVIYRAFGAANRLATARTLRRITRERGLVLLIGADWRLAAAVRADGVHLPERMVKTARGLRRKQPLWLITGAAHGASAIITGGRSGLDALLVSAVFPSRSPSAGKPWGAVRFAALVTASSTPVIALGGVTSATAARLGSSRAAGLAGVEGFLRAQPRRVAAENGGLDP